MKKHHSHKKDNESAKSRFFLLPSLITTFSLFSGFYAIVSAINGLYFNSAVAIIIAAIFDGLDGRVARLTGTTSRFGMEYDSLSDLVAFGVAPGLLAYQWALHPYGRYGWLAAFLYVATTALRLARFNSMDANKASKNFTGLPCPAAAGMVATSVLFYHFVMEGGLGDSAIQWIASKDIVLLLLVYTLSYLMVSSHEYLSFKHLETDKVKTFQVLVTMVLIVMLVATEPQVTLFLVALIYVLSGPVGGGYSLLTRQKKGVSEQEHTV
jgi:CDP-diacylglycerol--serine O-phosphatidyltransferase